MEPSFRHLLNQYASGKITPEELQRFTEMLAADDTNRLSQIEALRDWMIDQPESTSHYDKDDWKKVLNRILNTDKQEAPVSSIKKRTLVFYRYAAAIVLFLVVFGIGYFFLNRQWDLSQNAKELISIKQIEPGGDRATLTLSDGSVIELDTEKEGMIAEQGGTSIVKSNDGEIVYDTRGVASRNALLNTMRTPRGGQYRLILPDGSRVWLNAASSVTFPSAFTADERRLTVTGEVYVEVAHDARRPFIVDVDNKMLVRALGTEFNISAYPDEENIVTTLVEGKVKVSEPNSEGIVLLPGGQALLQGAGSPIRERTVSKQQIEQVLAWTKGYFNFENKSIEEMARQIERWYDVSFIFKGDFSDMVLSGKMDRGVSMPELIQFLKDYGLKTETKGRTITVRR